ncbi:hypothetical protein E2C01_068056 [Portunus trituberculatus]|uniref:Uncharacterized protein n=1 Tax=Portunus trituberculatus TaxID=210409 RepID=A0A5B7HMQ9_PORTR|nr:hypothetical protein [Portunus trituberculatus]
MRPDKLYSGFTAVLSWAMVRGGVSAAMTTNTFPDYEYSRNGSPQPVPPLCFIFTASSSPHEQAK